MMWQSHPISSPSNFCCFLTEQIKTWNDEVDLFMICLLRSSVQSANQNLWQGTDWSWRISRMASKRSGGCPGSWGGGTISCSPLHLLLTPNQSFNHYKITIKIKWSHPNSAWSDSKIETPTKSILYLSTFEATPRNKQKKSRRPQHLTLNVGF